MPRITIGIAFVDSRRTLPLAIASVLAQSLEDWELILVDDGSTDGSREVAQTVDDPRVRVLSDGKNLGLPERLNQIAGLSQADYVARMDADDAMLPTRLAAQVAYLDEHPSVDVVAGAAYAMDVHDRVYGLRSNDPVDLSPKAFLGNNLFIHPTITARRQWLIDNPYDPKLRRSQDKELWCRTRGTTTFAKLTEPVLFYREGGNFSWARYREQRQMDSRIVARYGPGAIGSAATAKKVVAIQGKLLLYRMLLAVGREEVLVRRRSARIADDDLASAQRQLDALLNRARGLLPDSGGSPTDGAGAVVTRQLEVRDAP